MTKTIDLGTERLAPRQCLAAALAGAMREPILRRGQSSIDPHMLQDAWTLCTAPIADAAMAELGLGETPPGESDIAPLIAWQTRLERDRQAAYARAFGLVVSHACPPMETEYCPSADPTHRAQVMADAAGFYRAFGVDARGERVDHISVILGFIAFMLEKRRFLSPDNAEGAARVADAQAAFVRDHVAWWIPTFAKALERQIATIDDPDGALLDLAGIARLLRSWVAMERMACAVEPSRRIVEPVVSNFEPCDETCHTCDQTPE